MLKISLLYSTAATMLYIYLNVLSIDMQTNKDMALTLHKCIWPPACIWGKL